jgi:N-acetyl-anhydromuramyl-L-alanine amidase AmpD
MKLAPMAIERPGLTFDGLPALAAPPPFLVGHWTGGEGGAERIHRVLVQRKLSVHFSLELDGDLVQHCDLDRRAAHAGRAGNVGLGVEASNMGFPRDDGTSPRPFDTQVIHGVKVRCVRFTDAQLARYVELAEWCAATYGWPRHVPNVLRVLTPAELARFRGALEHLHLSRRKCDAGGHFTAALVRAGWTPVAP